MIAKAPSPAAFGRRQKRNGGMVVGKGQSRLDWRPTEAAILKSNLMGIGGCEPTSESCRTVPPGTFCVYCGPSFPRAGADFVNVFVGFVHVPR